MEFSPHSNPLSHLTGQLQAVSELWLPFLLQFLLKSLFLHLNPPFNLHWSSGCVCVCVGGWGQPIIFLKLNQIEILLHQEQIIPIKWKESYINVTKLNLPVLNHNKLQIFSTAVILGFHCLTWSGAVCTVDLGGSGVSAQKQTYIERIIVAWSLFNGSDSEKIKLNAMGSNGARSTQTSTTAAIAVYDNAVALDGSSLS